MFWKFWKIGKILERTNLANGWGQLQNTNSNSFQSAEFFIPTLELELDFFTAAPIPELTSILTHCIHDDVSQWEHFQCYWPFVRGIQQSAVDFPQKGQWRRALMFSLICAWTNSWANNRDAGDLRWHRSHYDVTVMFSNTWRNKSIAWQCWYIVNQTPWN